MFKWFGAAIACLILLVVLVYVYDVPGGIADWRYSRAIGYASTLRIPIGKTPEDAVQKFRDNSFHVVHRESIDGGVLLFLKRDEQNESTNLQLEYVRKTWLGWKWAMGGGYSISSRTDSDEVLHYMRMSRFKGVDGPFPLVFGQITNSTITNIMVTFSGDGVRKYNAKIIEYGEGQKLWYVVPPSTAVAPYELEAISGEGSKVASSLIDESIDVASVLMSN